MGVIRPRQVRWHPDPNIISLVCNSSKETYPKKNFEEAEWLILGAYKHFSFYGSR